MGHRKIDFKEEHLDFISSYKESTGVSLQRFVADAVDEYIEKKKVEQYLKDLPYLNEK
jgi:hypothetical protein